MDDLDVSCSMDDVESMQAIMKISGVLEGDYVDIGAIFPHTTNTEDVDEYDCFQDIHCKKQKIVVMGNTHTVNAI
nr:CMF_HP1_G0006720.mRNA.1.CDS.1 [Saccharomyces cerevisiae]